MIIIETKLQENTTNNLPKTILTIAGSVTVALFFMWLAFRGLDFKKIKGYFAEANYLWVFAAAAFAMLAYWFRALRWNILLGPLGYRVGGSSAFWAIAFGYLMNLTVPRSGELARATALYGVEHVPVDQSFGTIILERIVDLICMLLFLGLALGFKYDAVVAFYKQSGIRMPTNRIFLIIGFLSGCAVLFLVFRNKFRSFPIVGRIIDFINGVLAGILSIFKLRHPLKFILYSLAIWSSYYLAAYLVCFALPETSNLTIADGFFIIVVGTLGMMVPASGGIGAFHYALKIGIGALFLSMGKTFAEGEEVGLAYAFISHTMQLVVMVILGFISIPMLAKMRKKA